MAKLAYSVAEAVAASSLSRASIYRAFQDGRLKKVKVCGRSVIPAASLEALIEGRAA